jgi:FtsZ-interacting cell division protein ZipA
MTGYEWLIVLGAVVLAVIVLKGFWSADKVKPTEQADDWQKHGGGADGGPF